MTIVDSCWQHKCCGGCPGTQSELPAWPAARQPSSAQRSRLAGHGLLSCDSLCDGATVIIMMPLVNLATGVHCTIWHHCLDVETHTWTQSARNLLTWMSPDRQAREELSNSTKFAPPCRLGGSSCSRKTSISRKGHRTRNVTGPLPELSKRQYRG